MSEIAGTNERTMSNCYINTRTGDTDPVPFTRAVINGIADSGGLYVPERIPTLNIEDIIGLSNMPYAQRAAYIYRAFDIDLPNKLIDELMQRSYNTNFDVDTICPLVSLDDKTHILELWHGPTSAFKDMALQCLPNFFAASANALRERGEINHEFCILVATSGDTGKAALEGFKNAPGIGIGVLFPDGGVSDIQRKQMVTTTGDNVAVWAVSGNFDDCQTGVKRVFSDEVFAQRLLDTYNMALSSANSINWGRLLPQIVYYISSYAELVHTSKIKPGELIDVCVPTGNFGNILAAWYAKQVGTPIDMLICASNENHVLSDFIADGIYDIRNRTFTLTPSPSMDILVSSNLERQLFELTGRDCTRIAQWMKDLNDKRCFCVDDDTKEAMRNTYLADWIDSNECLRTIKNVYQQYDYLLDPHTAVAYAVAQRQRRDKPVLIAGTAHWAKFGNNVYRALHDINANEPLDDDIAHLTGCQLNDLIAQQTGHYDIPARLAMLDSLPVRFHEVINGSVEGIENATRKFLAQVKLN